MDIYASFFPNMVRVNGVGFVLLFWVKSISVLLCILKSSGGKGLRFYIIHLIFICLFAIGEYTFGAFVHRAFLPTSIELCANKSTLHLPRGQVHVPGQGADRSSSTLRCNPSQKSAISCARLR